MNINWICLRKQTKVGKNEGKRNWLKLYSEIRLKRWYNEYWLIFMKLTYLDENSCKLLEIELNWLKLN